jgi:formylglycine-generating enzyme required for sulfatase activity
LAFWRATEAVEVLEMERVGAKESRTRGWRSSLLVAAIPLVGLAGLRNEKPASLPGGDPAGEMVLIPAGEFLMGSNADGDHAPAHRVRVDAFYLGIHEVTNGEYYDFCEATGHRLPEFWGIEARRSGPEFPHHPVVGVSWQDASDYAAWRGMRLPTEAEWEYAARGGLEGENFPTGDTLSPADANFAGSQIGRPVEVGRYATNGFGLQDMSGNVFEWVADRYGADYYAESPQANPAGPETGRFRIIRGGGWHSGPYCNRTYYRNALPPQWVDFAVGFRLAKDFEG